MDINGYELGSCDFLTCEGPLWATTAPDGTPALLALRTAEQGDGLVARWRAWASLGSPHVARLLDVVHHDDGRWAVVVERVPGDSLETVLARGGLRTREERARVVAGIRRGIEALHGAGLLHGDVSPGNVVVRPDGEPVLVDLIDDPGASRGTPGWSVGGAGGEQGDWEACARLAEEMEAPGVGGGGDRAVSEVLRRVAAAPATLRDDAPARHRAERAFPGRGRGLRVLVVAGALATALAVGLWVNDSAGGAPPGSEAASCPDAEEAREALGLLLEARDRAVEARDPAAVAAVSTGTVAEADRAVIAALEAAGIRVEGLSTTVGPVRAVACAPASVTLETALQQQAHRRCGADGTCAAVPAQPAHRVRLELGRDPWAVADVERLGSS